MDISGIFKLDDWWKVIMFIGVILCAVGLIFNIEIVSPKHLIGLGFGFFLIGLAYFIARKYINWVEYGGMFTKQIISHNIATRIILTIGIIISILFGALLIWNLI